MVILLVLIGLALFAFAAWRYGVDSRDGYDWKPLDPRPQFETLTRAHSPGADLASLRSKVRRFFRHRPMPPLREQSV